MFEEDNDTLSDIDDNEVLILFLSLAGLLQWTRPPTLRIWLGLVLFLFHLLEG